MSLKTLANKATTKASKQMLTLQRHSPALLVAVGIVGVGGAMFLACQATLKMSETIDEFESDLQEINPESEGEADKKVFGAQVKLAIKIARLYAPAAIVGLASVGAITGSHLILKKRNAGLAAAYTIVHKTFDDYRGRVIKDVGPEKDMEYFFGTVKKEIVEEGLNGPEVKWIEGPDQKAIQDNEENTYARVFAPKHADGTDNDNWQEVKYQNQQFIQMVLNHARDALQTKGYIFLNDVYDMLGFKRTKAGSQVGWVKGIKYDPVTGEQITDGYVDFGLWEEGMYKGKQWVNGSPRAFLLNFNVDGVIIDEVLEKM